MSSERTHYEAQLDIDYAIELHARHIKLYRHLRWLFSLVFLVSGSVVFAGALAELGPLAKWTGAAIALCAILDHLTSPAEKAAQHHELKRRWCELRAESGKLKLTEIDRRISALRGEDVHIISALQTPSYNANLRRHGHEAHVRRLSAWEWLVDAVA